MTGDAAGKLTGLAPDDGGRGMPESFIRVEVDRIVEPDALRALVARHGFSVANLNYRLLGEGGQFEYRMVMRTLKTDDVRRLSETLNADRAVTEYRISPASD